MTREFSLFQSHLDLAHNYWSNTLKAGDCAVDATCGNGHDTLKLAQHVLKDKSGRVIAIDCQEKAIKSTRQLIEEQLTPGQIDQVTLVHASHETFPADLAPSSVSLVVYNLGYLPGANKQQTTMTSTTLASLSAAVPLIAPAGLISITCYPGHPEGKIEEAAILDWAAELDPKLWSCCHHRWVNRQQAPSLLLMQRKK